MKRYSKLNLQYDLNCIIYSINLPKSRYLTDGRVSECFEELVWGDEASSLSQSTMQYGVMWWCAGRLVCNASAPDVGHLIALIMDQEPPLPAAHVTVTWQSKIRTTVRTHSASKTNPLCIRIFGILANIEWNEIFNSRTTFFIYCTLYYLSKRMYWLVSVCRLWSASKLFHSQFDLYICFFNTVGFNFLK